MPTFIPLLFSILYTPLLLGAESCQDLSIQLEKDSSRLIELLKLREELEEKFQGYVSQDFKEQTEGVFQGLNRNAAIKAAFARKKITKSIEKQKVTVATTKESFCDKCRSLASEQEKSAFCQRCPNKPECLR